MPRFNVHLSPTVRVRVDAIDAVDHVAAPNWRGSAITTRPIASRDPGEAAADCFDVITPAMAFGYFCGSSCFGSCRIIFRRAAVHP
jgi:hypothetical protein